MTPLSPDADSAPFWDATRSGRFVIQRCAACSTYQHYPRVLCTTCSATDLTFVEVSGRGSIYSFTVVHRSPNPKLFPVPYVVALIKLEEGPLLMSNIVSADPTSIKCDQPVELEWKDRSDGFRLPMFRPATISHPT